MMAMTSCKRAKLYLDVIRRLGFWNVAYVVWYRFTLKSGIRERFFPQQPFVSDSPFFRPVARCASCPAEFQTALLKDADKIIQGQLRYYAYHWKTVGNPPNWFLNPFNSRLWPNPNRHSTDIADFEGGIGDIKNIWEASRFEWVVTLSRAYAVSGERVYLDTLNRWLDDWALKNPVNIGPNWKCGQEVAIRVFNLMQAASILGQWYKTSPALNEFIERHLERISANIRYAIAQDNNHGTSEAAALFIGGNWLAKNDSNTPKTLDSRLRGNDKGGSGNHRSKKYDHFAFQGRKWLENRIAKLVEKDGSFSQHSVTYHRLLLDTLIFVEFWRRQFEAEPFSDTFYQRSRAALSWLSTMTDEKSGAAPNLGANDGAMLLNAHGCDYRDFRPSLQTASVLFCGRRIFPEGPWDEPGYWLGIKGDVSPDTLSTLGVAKTSQVLPGGYVIMAGQASWGMLRFPMYRFRPGHNDVFHFDLWWRGTNICRDDGSYSYYPEDVADVAYFGSVKAHNTVCFDGDEQMPRLGRFLLGKWIAADQIGAIERRQDGWKSWSGAYRDWKGRSHQRLITWKDAGWIIEDNIAGNFQKAEIRFRLAPDKYELRDDGVSSSWGRVMVSGTDFRISLEDGFESLYYQEKQPAKVMVIRPAKGCNKIATRFLLGSQRHS